MQKNTIIKIVQWGIFIGIFIVTLLYSLKLAVIENRPPDGYDENMWTGASITSYNMFFKGYIRDVTIVDGWFEQYAQQYHINTRAMQKEELQWYDNAIWTFGWKAPNVGKYLMGFAIVNFGNNVNPEGNFYHWNPDKTQNKWPGNYSPAEHVWLARVVNAILNALGIGLLFFIGWYFINYTTGIVASLYLLFNETYMMSNTGAMLESSSIFFTILTIVLLMKFFQSFTKFSIKQNILYSIFIGISFSLAVGCKLNAGLIGYTITITFIVAGIFLWKKIKSQPDNKEQKKKEKSEFQHQKQKYRQLFLNSILSMAIIFSTTFAVFVGLHPHLRTDTVKKVQIIRESIDRFFDIRAQALGSKHIKDSFVESASLFIKRNYIKTEDAYYGTFGKLLPLRFNPLDGIFIIVGLIGIIRLAIKEAKANYLINHFAFFILFYAIYFWGLVDFLWIDWSRYHVPIYPMNALLVGISFSVIGKKLFEIMPLKSFLMRK